jgi:hypothetical protein
MSYMIVYLVGLRSLIILIKLLRHCLKMREKQGFENTKHCAGERRRNDD